MVDKNICRWLLDNADAPIRYRVARELLCDEALANEIEAQLLNNDTVKKWLYNLVPDSPPRHWSMEHGSFDFCLENALLKSVQLGLHCGFPQTADAVRYYLDKIESLTPCGYYRANDGFRLGEVNFGFYSIIIANLLTLAGIENSAVRGCMLGGLDELFNFTIKGDYDIYADEKERGALKAVPAVWSDRKFIKRALVDTHGFCYPFIYDVIGLYNLYGRVDTETDRKIDAVIGYISTDIFHKTVEDGYGILISGDRTYHSMGWDPKYPGWFDVAGYIENGNVPKLLFFAQYISNYPAARKTKWFSDLLGCLDKHRTGEGRHKFPAGWLKEQRGYAVQGSHISFGENRKKKNWREIESTFYIQLLQKYL